jgi:hypothetical protein
MQREVEYLLASIFWNSTPLSTIIQCDGVEVFEGGRGQTTGEASKVEAKLLQFEAKRLTVMVSQKMKIFLWVVNRYRKTTTTPMSLLQKTKTVIC